MHNYCACLLTQITLLQERSVHSPVVRLVGAGPLLELLLEQFDDNYLPCLIPQVSPSLLTFEMAILTAIFICISMRLFACGVVPSKPLPSQLAALGSMPHLP